MFVFQRLLRPAVIRAALLTRCEPSLTMPRRSRGKASRIRRPSWASVWLNKRLIRYRGGELLPRLRRLVLERLMRYYRFLSESTARKPLQTVTSAQVAEALDIDPTQVRKDFSAIGLLGMGRVGFDVCEVCRAIRVELGFDQTYDAVLIGAGHLGGALLAYRGFARYGLHVVGAFDNDKDRIGGEIAGCVIRPMRGMKSLHQAAQYSPCHPHDPGRRVPETDGSPGCGRG